MIPDDIADILYTALNAYEGRINGLLYTHDIEYARAWLDEHSSLPPDDPFMDDVDLYGVVHYQPLTDNGIQD